MATSLKAKTEKRQTAVCVVGGGIAGMCAAVSAARQGCEVTLIQDRAVLGGNASSEVRMWISGAHGRFYKESGLVEELQLLNYHRNPGMKYSIWDTVLYEMVKSEPGITLLLSCSVCEVATRDKRIQSVTAWHLTRQCWIQVSAEQFIDCSGDSVLRFSGADHRWGREGEKAFGESLGVEAPDRKTMGSSLLIQLREIDPEDHVPFVAPGFAIKLDDAHPRVPRCHPKRAHNFWWLEVGGESDTIDDADAIRDELYAIAYGVWDYIKNHPDGRGHGWELEWIGSLPGKRENVRYVGNYTLKQQDIDTRGQFDDIVAYGGWTMDDHPPAAFHHPGEPTEHHSAPSPYGIPYRCLVSRNIENLLFAGRNISATHMALSSTRVMGTCALLGQAAGTAASLCVQKAVAPVELGERYLPELQNRLLESDQWLPGHRRMLPAQTRKARLFGTRVEGSWDDLLDGHERRLKDGDHWVTVAPGGCIEFSWDEAVELERLRLVVHTNLHDVKRMPCSYPKKRRMEAMPSKMPKQISLHLKRDQGWEECHRWQNNCKRLLQIDLAGKARAVRVVFEEAWGGGDMAVFSCEVGRSAYGIAPDRVDWPEVIMTGRGTA